MDKILSVTEESVDGCYWLNVPHTWDYTYISQTRMWLLECEDCGLYRSFATILEAEDFAASHACEVAE